MRLGVLVTFLRSVAEVQAPRFGPDPRHSTDTASAVEIEEFQYTLLDSLRILDATHER